MRDGCSAVQIKPYYRELEMSLPSAVPSWSLFSAISIFFIVLFCSAIQPTQAGPFEDGAVAYERGDYIAAFKLLHPLAEDGNVGAQIIVGGMYSEGSSVENDTDARNIKPDWRYMT
jgi:hypothetical protein